VNCSRKLEREESKEKGLQAFLLLFARLGTSELKSPEVDYNPSRKGKPQSVQQVISRLESRGHRRKSTTPFSGQPEISKQARHGRKDLREKPLSKETPVSCVLCLSIRRLSLPSDGADLRGVQSVAKKRVFPGPSPQHTVTPPDPIFLTTGRFLHEPGETNPTPNRGAGAPPLRKATPQANARSRKGRPGLTETGRHGGRFALRMSCSLK
jgi:hypothetical protein